MLVRLDIVTDRHSDALVVPKRALQREGDTNFIYVADEGTAHRIEVREGFSDDESVEIFAVEEPIEPGMPVIAVGNRDLEEGDAVDAEEWRPSEKALAADRGDEELLAEMESDEGEDTRPDDAAGGMDEGPDGDRGDGEGDETGPTEDPDTETSEQPAPDAEPAAASDGAD